MRIGWKDSQEMRGGEEIRAKYTKPSQLAIVLATSLNIHVKESEASYS
jgi:hypothetical protein